MPPSRKASQNFGGTRAIILTRQSVTDDDSVSLAMQEERCRQYCQQKGYTVTRVTTEESTRGWREDREVIEFVRQQAAMDGFDVLVAFKLSRVARSLVIQELLLRELEKHGKRFESVMEPWASNILVRQILGAINENETRELSSYTKAAKRQAAKQGRWSGGIPPTGYDVEGNTLIPNHEAAMVRMIFSRYANGASFSGLSVEMQVMGFGTRKGKPWNPDTIREILRNHHYVGDVYLNGELMCRDAHEPLVSREEFDLVQRRMTERVKRRSGKYCRSWLEGLTVHACGHRMYMVQNGRWPALRCSSHLIPARNDKCDMAPRNVSIAKADRGARLCLIADLGSVAPVGDAIDRADQAAGGMDARAARTRIDVEMAEAERRYERAREVWLANDEPLSFIEAEKQRLVDVTARLTRERDNLPSAPNVDEYRRMADSIRDIGSAIGTMGDDDLAFLLEELGLLVYSPDGFSIRYRPVIRDFFPAPASVQLPWR